MRRLLLVTFLFAGQMFAQRAVLATGAHAGDMELTAGAVLAKAAKRGDRVVLLHLTLGERGNRAISPEEYGKQKRGEAAEAAKALGGEAMFGPYRDGELPNDEATRQYVAGVIRQVKPSIVITHWKNSMHRDHAATSAIVSDAILLASFDGVSVRSLWFAENWEDAEGFQPYIYVDVSDVIAQWREAVTKYAFVRGGISSFAYLDYYSALATLRGAESRKKAAEAFDIAPYGKKRILDDLP